MNRKGRKNGKRLFLILLLLKRCKISHVTHGLLQVAALEFKREKKRTAKEN